MPHSYPLHTSVLAECLCCHSRQRFEFTSASDQVVCAACTRHLGLEKAVQRDAAHVALWAALLRHSEESAALDREAAALAAAAREVIADVAYIDEDARPAFPDSWPASPGLPTPPPKMPLSRFPMIPPTPVSPLMPDCNACASGPVI